MKRLLGLAIMAAFVVTLGVGCSDTATTKTGTSASTKSSPTGTTETKKEEKKP